MGRLSAVRQGLNSVGRMADVSGKMLIYHPAKTNAQRQREFRERNPGYYGRLHAKRRAAALHAVAVHEVKAAAESSVAVPEESVTPLLLPAPVETFVIPTLAELRTQREAVCVER